MAGTKSDGVKRDPRIFYRRKDLLPGGFAAGAGIVPVGVHPVGKDQERRPLFAFQQIYSLEYGVVKRGRSIGPYAVEAGKNLFLRCPFQLFRLGIEIDHLDDGVFRQGGNELPGSL